MKSKKLQLMFAGIFLCAAVIPAFAQKNSRQERELETSSRELDKSAALPSGQQRVTDKINGHFDVDETGVAGLRLKHLGYGEIAIVLGLAQNMPRGIRDENLYRIVALRQGPPVMGWGNVAKELGLKLGPVISGVRKIGSGVRKQENADKIKESKKAKKEKAKKDEMSEKMARPGKTVKEGIKSLPRK